MDSYEEILRKASLHNIETARVDEAARVTSDIMSNIAVGLKAVPALSKIAFSATGKPLFYARLPRENTKNRFTHIEVLDQATGKEQIEAIVRAVLLDMDFEHDPSTAHTVACWPYLKSLSAHERLTIMADVGPRIQRALRAQNDPSVEDIPV